MAVSRGAVPQLWSRTLEPSAFQPQVQVVDLTPIGDESTKRFKVKVTDGEFWTEALLTNSLAQLAASGQLFVHSLIRMTAWRFVSVQRKNGASSEIMAIEQGEVLGVVPEASRCNLHHLRQYPEKSSSGMSQATQAALPSALQWGRPPGVVPGPVSTPAPWERPQQPQQQPPQQQPLQQQPFQQHPKQQEQQREQHLLETQPAAREQQHYTTPEKRVGASAPMEAAVTPNPLPQHPHQQSVWRPEQQPLPPWSNVAAKDNPFSVSSASSTAAPAAAVETATTKPMSSLGSWLKPQPGSTGSGSTGAPAVGFLGRGGATSRLGQDGNIIPLTGLSPYMGRWKIKARVIFKESIRKFSNARGEGQLFKIDLIDSSGAEVSATFFGKAVDRYFHTILPGQVYFFSRGSVKAANKRWDKGEHVITFEEGAVVELASEDEAIPGIKYHFRPLAEVADMPIGTQLDVKGVITDVKEAYSVVVRTTNQEKMKRAIFLWDNSGSIELTVWGDPANEDFQVGAVFYSRGARVAEWNGVKALNVFNTFELNPDDPQAFALLRAYEAAGRPSGYSSSPSGAASPSKAAETIAECKEADLHLGSAAQDPGQTKPSNRHRLTAIVTRLPSDKPPYYMACPHMVERLTQFGTTQGAPRDRQCQKKLMQDEEGVWRCAAGHACDKPIARYLCRFEVVDFTGRLDISSFEAARQLFGIDANDLATIWENPELEVDKLRIIHNGSWKRYSLRVRSFKERFMDEDRTKVTADDITPLSSAALAMEGHRMLGEVLSSLGCEQCH